MPAEAAEVIERVSTADWRGVEDCLRQQPYARLPWRIPPQECARLAALWDPAHPDENVDYYHAKVQEIWTRFRNIVEHDGLRPATDQEDDAQLKLFE